MHLVIESDFDNLNNGSILFDMDWRPLQKPEPMPSLGSNMKLYVDELKLYYHYLQFTLTNLESQFNLSAHHTTNCKSHVYIYVIWPVLSLFTWPTWVKNHVMHSLQTQVKELRERVNSPNDTVETMRLVNFFMIVWLKLLSSLRAHITLHYFCNRPWLHRS